ncbi:putative secreted protein (Por secretion system target) [Neolewinella xylanilytica]|uniref:Putative secreted protein (Por secretion system target) n=1 Tax=Neolewinella xylanilytica TaxID=1514080 RepID=A0A2S6I1N9_9BACT|nr:T9SS type A sorting domain-containing protein [Neolewinella xylanilytica]PPK85095.1 putative secreted protein (Por secretion system target) [Neolewinella xylanilytica]
MRLPLFVVFLLSGLQLLAQFDSTGHSITCWSRDTVTGIVVPPPASIVDGTAALQTRFDLIFTDSVPPEAEESIRFAADVWGKYLQSDVPIRVQVDWLDQGDDRILASAGPSTLYRGFAGVPDSEVWYPVALAEAIFGEDLNDTTDADINVVVNSRANWNYATEGTVPRNRIDLASVIFHEFGHGLGFLSSIDSTSDTTVSIGFNDRFIVYDLFLETPPGLSLSDTIRFPSPSRQLLDAIIDRLEFAGERAVEENNGELVPLFAPEVFDIGSSVSHLDENTYPAGTEDALMTPSIASGEAIRMPGPVTLGVLFDLGWPLRFDLISAIREVVTGRLKVYPNPAYGSFTLEMDEVVDPAFALLYSPDGRQVGRQAISPNADGRARIGIENLPAGVYTVVVPDGHRLFTGRVVVL